jgi:hypothetical protein
MKRLLAALLILALLPNPLWAASYKSSVRQLMLDGNPYCTAVAISERPETSLFLTAAHCFAPGQTIDGHPVTVITFNKALDLMLVQTEGYLTPALRLGREAKVGDRVLWAGYPRETDAKYTQYWGKVESLHNDFSAFFYTWESMNIVHFDERHGFLNGNSGGAVIREGKLVGIVVAQFFEEGSDPDTKPIVKGGYVSRAAIEAFLGI